jgi:hypothetical protein
VAVPLVKLPAWISIILAAPIPLEMQQLHAWGWIVTPLVAFALGSYCLDSKNSFCIFPGTPYFHRVLNCNIATDGTPDESRRGDLKAIRDWTLAQSPPETKSSHWWYKDLAGEAQTAFDRCAHAPQVLTDCIAYDRTYFSAHRMM